MKDVGQASEHKVQAGRGESLIHSPPLVPRPTRCHPHQEHSMGIQMDAQLDAIDNFLPSPLGDPKVGDQGHDRNCKEPEGEEVDW